MCVGSCRPLQANLAAVKVLPTRSAAVRSYAESHLLESLSGRLATVALSGFMFFGSSVLMSDKVCDCDRHRAVGFVCLRERGCGRLGGALSSELCGAEVGSHAQKGEGTTCTA